MSRRNKHRHDNRSDNSDNDDDDGEFDDGGNNNSRGRDTTENDLLRACQISAHGDQDEEIPFPSNETSDKDHL